MVLVKMSIVVLVLARVVLVKMSIAVLVLVTHGVGEDVYLGDCANHTIKLVILVPIIYTEHCCTCQCCGCVSVSTCSC